MAAGPTTPVNDWQNIQPNDWQSVPPGPPVAQPPKGFVANALDEAKAVAKGAWGLVEPPKTTTEKVLSVLGPEGVIAKRLLEGELSSRAELTKQAAEQFKEGKPVTGAISTALAGLPIPGMPGIAVGVNEAEKRGDQAGAAGRAAVDLATMGLGGMAGKMLAVTPETVIRKLAFASGEGTTAPIEATIKDIQSAAQAKPPATIGEFQKTVGDAKANLNREYANALGPHANQQTMPANISQRILALETPNMQQTAAGRFQAAIIRKAAAEFQKPWTLGQLDAERMDANARLHAFEKKNIADQYAATKGQSRSAAIDKAIADGVRETVYPEMDRLAGKPAGYFRDLKDRVGNLMQLESRVNETAEKLHDVSTRAKGAPVLEKARVGMSVGAGGKPHGWIGNLLGMIHTPNPEATASAAVRGAFRPSVSSLPLGALLGSEAAGSHDIAEWLKPVPIQ